MTAHDADVIVVGAGICGSTAARAARAHGATVLHLAAPTPPHSVAAAAVLRSTYLPAHLRHTLTAAVYAYGPAITAHGALVTNYRTPHRPPTPQNDWHLVDPHHPLATPDLHTHVTAVHGRTLTTTTGTYTAARAVILATGATSDLSPPGTTTWGVTWTGPTEALTRPDQLRVHHWAPYKAITAGPAAGLARVGSSSGPTPQAALAAAHTLLDTAVAAGMVADPHALTPHLGARLKTPHTLTHPQPGVHWIGGHHRNGYALAHHDTHRLLHEALT